MHFCMYTHVHPHKHTLHTCTHKHTQKRKAIRSALLREIKLKQQRRLCNVVKVIHEFTGFGHCRGVIFLFSPAQVWMRTKEGMKIGLQWVVSCNACVHKCMQYVYSFMQVCLSWIYKELCATVNATMCVYGVCVCALVVSPNSRRAGLPCVLQPGESSDPISSTRQHSAVSHIQARA